MQTTLQKLLVCPKCRTGLTLDNGEWEGDEIMAGSLTCGDCGKVYPVTGGIPRFVESDNYASSFGYQWNLFRKEQIDSHNGTSLSATRFWSETGWEPGETAGKWMLDAGCGAGRFLDVSTRTEADVVGIDISNAIDAARKNLEGRGNAHFVQASIYELPFREGTFDLCYCIGVIQHTPDPSLTLRSIARMVKSGGKLAVTIYEKRKWFTKLHSKYLLRPVTRRISKETLLKIITGVMPFAFPVTDALFRIPYLGKIFMFVIPVANYVNEKELTRDLRYKWAILDTFDMLSPQFDQPQVASEVAEIIEAAGFSELKRLPVPGLNLTGVKT